MRGRGRVGCVEHLFVRLFLGSSLAGFGKRNSAPAELLGMRSLQDRKEWLFCDVGGVLLTLSTTVRVSPLEAGFLSVAD